MKMLWTALLLLPGLSVHTNEQTVSALRGENKLFIVTLDGLRWQEVFNGADTALLHHRVSTKLSSQNNTLYSGATPEERRQKLLPFFWNVIARKGELYGNRRYGNRLNVANPYALSYPGYNELLTGSVDPTIYGNGKVFNANTTVLDYLAATVTYKGKVAAFSSWDAFPYILNKNNSRFYINSGYEAAPELPLTKTEAFLNRIRESFEDNKHTRYDRLTFSACTDYIRQHKPSVVLLSFGGTDEAAHQKKYDDYLRQAADADKMIGELWQYLQADPHYAGQTTLLITTDHGRGKSVQDWHTHGIFTSGSSQTWMALLGKGIGAGGEQKKQAQLYQKQLKGLMLKLLAQE